MKNCKKKTFFTKTNFKWLDIHIHLSIQGTLRERAITSNNREPERRKVVGGELERTWCYLTICSMIINGIRLPNQLTIAPSFHRSQLQSDVEDLTCGGVVVLVVLVRTSFVSSRLVVVVVSVCLQNIIILSFLIIILSFYLLIIWLIISIYYTYTINIYSSILKYIKKIKRKKKIWIIFSFFFFNLWFEHLSFVTRKLNIVLSSKAYEG